MSSNRSRRIAKELKDLKNDPVSNIEVEIIRDDLNHLRGSFMGPEGTPYQGGKYFVEIKIPNEYPFRPPTMKFETKLWHPNVSSVTVRLSSLCTSSS
jgi:ubiquitin-conjugating enzyme (huntingtin interacting protein 2)